MPTSHTIQRAIIPRSCNTEALHYYYSYGELIETTEVQKSRHVRAIVDPTLTDML